MYPTTCTTAVGVFTSRFDADEAIAELHEEGFTVGQVGMVMRDQQGTTKTVKTDDRQKRGTEDASEGALVGAVAGAGIGGLIGAAVLAGVVPAIGPALFAGTLGVLASNAASGAAVAGIFGALVAWGVPEEDAEYYEGEIAAGRVIVTVTTEDRCEEARAILRRHGATSRDPVLVSPDM